MSNQKHVHIKIWPIIGLLSIFMVTSFGCEPLRKKFTRKKKEDKVSQGFIPVLDPIEYDRKRVSSKEKYAYHFSMWRIWQRELSQVLETDSNDKRQRYLIAQLVIQMEEMDKWVEGATKDRVNEYLGELREINKELDRPAELQNKISIERKLTRISSKVRNNLNPKKEQNYKPNE